jgi:hypothetical protein
MHMSAKIFAALYKQTVPGHGAERAKACHDNGITHATQADKNCMGRDAPGTLPFGIREPSVTV